MCLILLAYRPDARRRLVIAANRDEFYARPTLAAHWWEDERRVYGGRDVQAGGTWLAASRAGRMAAVTNWTEPGAAPGPSSRGELAGGFLTARVSARQFAAAIDGDRYSGFNFIAYDGEELVYNSNRTGEVRALPPGAYGLTNTRLGAGAGDASGEWPKAALGAAALKNMAATASADDLIALLRQSLLPPEAPAAGEPAPERRNSPCFIRGADYGTRASTAIILGEASLAFVEQQYGPHGKPGQRTAVTIRLTARSEHAGK